MSYKEQEFKRIKGNIESNGGSFNLSEYEIEQLIEVVRKIDEYNANIGYLKERADHCEREKAFQQQWIKQNTPYSWLNKGNGTLQDLFISDQEYVHVITEKERWIVATVIQWLGTNCGMCFLEETLAKFGKKIVDK